MNYLGFLLTLHEIVLLAILSMIERHQIRQVLHVRLWHRLPLNSSGLFHRYRFFRLGSLLAPLSLNKFNPVFRARIGQFIVLNK